jgi:hypothetical protein
MSKNLRCLLELAALSRGMCVCVHNDNVTAVAGRYHTWPSHTP